jgi:hypothetical protein
MQLEADTSIRSKPHPWTDADWAHYFRVRQQEDNRERYCHRVKFDLKVADKELAVLLTELTHVRALKVPPTARPARQTVAREIRGDIKHLRKSVARLEAELDRIEPNWRTWLKPDDPRHDPKSRPSSHIGCPSLGWKRGGYPPPWYDGA